MALSFPGEHRPFVAQVAGHLSATVGRKRVLYDKFFEAQFARPDLDVYLPRLYREKSELIVLFLCQEYAAKRWCRLEWRHIRQLISTTESSRIMLLSFGSPGDLSELGILAGDGYVDIGSRPASEIAELILQRLEGTAEWITEPPQDAAFEAVAGPVPESLHREDEAGPDLATVDAAVRDEPALRHSLVWLAQRMKQQGMELFEIEELQPAWLSAAPQRWFYALLTRGITGTLLTVPLLRFFPYPFLPLCGMTAGLVVGLIDTLPIWPEPATQLRQAIRLSLFRGAMVGASTFPSVFLIARNWINTPLGFSAILALLFALSFGLRPAGLMADTRLYELQWGWSWKGFLFGFGGAFVAVMGLVALSQALPEPAGELVDLSVRFWVILAIALSMITALFGGLLGNLISFRKRSFKGMRQVIRNGLRVAGGVAAVLAFAIAIVRLYPFLRASQEDASGDGEVLGVLFLSLSAGAALGAYVGFWFSGIDALQHVILRRLLDWTGQFPWHWVRCLDHATDQGLLFKVENGYKFPRIAVRDYFASLSEKPIENS